MQHVTCMHAMSIFIWGLGLALPQSVWDVAAVTNAHFAQESCAAAAVIRSAECHARSACQLTCKCSWVLFDVT